MNSFQSEKTSVQVSAVQKLTVSLKGKIKSMSTQWPTQPKPILVSVALGDQ